MTTRVASHAGSWYSNNASKLAQDLDTWLDNVDLVVEGRNIEQVCAVQCGLRYLWGLFAMQ